MGFVGNLFGGGAARHAANVANVRAQTLATQQQNAGQTMYNDIMGQAQNQNQNLLNAGNQAYNSITGLIPSVTQPFQPMIQAGQAAASQYQSELPYLSTPFTPTQAQLAATPGYQFAQQQGLAATQNAAAAKGLGVSGNALQAAGNYATGLAQNTYAQDAQIYQNNQQTIANDLLNGVNSGTQAANASGGLASGLQQAAAGDRLNAQTNAANLMQGGQQTAAADFLNQYNQGASTRMSGYNDAVAGQIAYNNAIASGLQTITNAISAVRGGGQGNTQQANPIAAAPNYSNVGTGTGGTSSAGSVIAGTGGGSSGLGYLSAGQLGAAGLNGANALSAAAPAPSALGQSSSMFGQAVNFLGGIL